MQADAARLPEAIVQAWITSETGASIVDKARMENLMRSSCLAVSWISAAILVGAALPACERAKSESRSPNTEAPATKPTRPRTRPSQTKPAAVVDPSELSIIFSGELLGRLEPCGCSELQRGGLARRPVAIPAGGMQLRVENGSLIEELAIHAHLKLQTAMQALATMHYAAVSLGPHDLVLIAEMGIENLPADPPLLCANLRSEDGAPLLHPGVRARVSAAGKSATINIVGVTSDNDEACEAATMIPGARLTDPAEAAAQELKRLAAAGRADMNLLLFAGPPDELTDDRNFRQSWDVIVCQGFADEPEVESRPGANEPIVVVAGVKGRFLGQLLVPTKASDRRRAALRALPVEDAFKPDRVLERQFRDYLDQLRALNPMESIPRLRVREGPIHVGSTACAECHEDEHRFWKRTAHSHATETLVKKGREFDPDCIGCHAVAVEYESGFVSLEKTPELADVGCESCHGPGSAHSDNPTTPYPTPPKNCTTCHDDENDPMFELLKYLPKIKHWQDRPG